MTRMRPSPRQDAEPTRPLRVLLTTDWWEPVVNGVVASVQTLRRELLALGCDVRVLTLSQGIRTRSEQGVYRIGSVSASMVYDRARIGMPASRRVLREILRWRPDVVHSQCEFSTHVWARRIARTLAVPLVHTYHTIYEDYTHYYSPSRSVGRKVVKTFSRRVLAGTDAVVVPTARSSGSSPATGSAPPCTSCRRAWTSSASAPPRARSSTRTSGRCAAGSASPPSSG